MGKSFRVSTPTRSPTESTAKTVTGKLVLAIRRILTRLSATIFISIASLAVVLWLYLARQMPRRYFVWFVFLTVAVTGVNLIIAESFGKRAKQDRFQAILLEGIQIFIFVAAFYFFAVHLYPGVR
jgi:hypothetical protein